MLRYSLRRRRGSVYADEGAICSGGRRLSKFTDLYAQVTPKARHNSHDEVPYEKNKGSSKQPRQLHDYILDLRGVHHFSHDVFWEFLSLTLRNQIGRPETKQQTFGKFNMKTTPQSN